jgi:predicted phosphatase
MHVINKILKKTIKPKYRLAIFDMDQTLVDQTIYEDVFHIMKEFKSLKINMAIASYNPYAAWLCDRYDITKYFDIICGYPHEGKLDHIKTIRNYYKENGVTYDDTEIIFFDDDKKNISDVSRITGIRCITVNPKKGINKNVVNLVNCNQSPLPLPLNELFTDTGSTISS